MWKTNQAGGIASPTQCRLSPPPQAIAAEAGGKEESGGGVRGGQQGERDVIDVSLRRELAAFKYSWKVFRDINHANWFVRRLPMGTWEARTRRGVAAWQENIHVNRGI